MLTVETVLRHFSHVLLWILLVSTCDSSNAQFRRGFFGDISDVQARATELNPPDKDIPETDRLLYDESRRLDEEIRDLRGMRTSGDFAQDLIQLDTIRKDVGQAVTELLKLDCLKVQTSRLRNITNSLAKVSSYVSRKFFNEDVEAPSPNPWETAPWRTRERLSFDKEFCEELRVFVGDTSTQQNLLGYIDKLVVVVNQEKKVGEDNKKSVDGLLDLLQKRRAAVQAKLDAKSTQQQIGGSLWLVILVIGGLSVAAIIAIKVFEAQIQMEWVASGQVIQFVTVMVLLSVVMALGLANILKETTLGTLLGGIAGYVLAQGVGRAAAREVQRGRTSGALGTSVGAGV